MGHATFTPLSIFIPTFNRPDALLMTVRTIAPQLTATTRLVIIDNCCDTPVQSMLSDSVLPNREYIQIRRNRANIGGNANICRCLEEAESEWVWVIGDDDPIVNSAVADALTLIGQAADDCLYIGFAHAGIPGGSQVIKSLDRFLALSARGVGDILFITTGIFRVGTMQRNIHFAHQWASTCAPHLTLLLSHWEEQGGTVLLVERDLRQVVKRLTTGGQSQLISFCLALLPHLPMAWARNPHLSTIVAKRFLNPQALIYESFLEVRRGRQPLRLGIRYYHATARLKYSGLHWWREEARFAFYLFRFILYRWAQRMGVVHRPPSEDEKSVVDRR